MPHHVMRLSRTEVSSPNYTQPELKHSSYDVIFNEFMSRQETRGCKPSAGRIAPYLGIGLFSLTQLGKDNTDNKFEELRENGE